MKEAGTAALPLFTQQGNEKASKGKRNNKHKKE